MPTVRFVAAIVGALVLMGLPHPGRAQLDLSGDWIEVVQTIIGQRCALHIEQTGTELQLSQDCLLGPDAFAVGTLEPSTSTFTAEGG